MAWPLSHWYREGKTLVVRPLKKTFFMGVFPKINQVFLCRFQLLIDWWTKDTFVPVRRKVKLTHYNACLEMSSEVQTSYSFTLYKLSIYPSLYTHSWSELSEPFSRHIVYLTVKKHLDLNFLGNPANTMIQKKKLV